MGASFLTVDFLAAASAFFLAAAAAAAAFFLAAASAFFLAAAAAVSLILAGLLSTTFTFFARAALAFLYEARAFANTLFRCTVEPTVATSIYILKRTPSEEGDLRKILRMQYRE